MFINQLLKASHNSRKEMGVAVKGVVIIECGLKTSP